MGTDPVYCVTFSPDSKALATCAGRAVVLWDVGTSKPGDTLWGPAPARCLAFHPDGKTLVVASDNTDVLVRDVPGKRPGLAMGMVGHESGVRDAVWRADGGLLQRPTAACGSGIPAPARSAARRSASPRPRASGTARSP